MYALADVLDRVHERVGIALLDEQRRDQQRGLAVLREDRRAGGHGADRAVSVERQPIPGDRGAVGGREAALPRVDRDRVDLLAVAGVELLDLLEDLARLGVAGEVARRLVRLRVLELAARVGRDHEDHHPGGEDDPLPHPARGEGAHSPQALQHAGVSITPRPAPSLVRHPCALCAAVAGPFPTYDRRRGRNSSRPGGMMGPRATRCARSHDHHTRRGRGRGLNARGSAHPPPAPAAAPPQRGAARAGGARAPRPGGPPDGARGGGRVRQDHAARPGPRVVADAVGVALLRPAPAHPRDARRPRRGRRGGVVPGRRLGPAAGRGARAPDRRPGERAARDDPRRLRPGARRRARARRRGRCSRPWACSRRTSPRTSTWP